MVFTRKFSEFVPGTVDETVGLTTGANTIGPSGGGGGSGSVIETINQDTSGLLVGRWVRFDDATQLYVHGIATSEELAEIAGVVRDILSPTQFELQQSGYIESGTAGFNGFSTTGTYFLSDTVAGLQTLTPPTDNGRIRLPLFIADSTDSGWVCSLKTGMVIGSPGPIPVSGGGGGDPSTHTVNQPGNTFSIGDWIRVSGNTIYSLADGSTFANSQGVGVVTASGDPNFTLQFSGFNSGSVFAAVDAVGAPIAITSSTVYYLSDVVPGQISPVKPTAIGASVKPCYISESSTSMTGYVLPQQPLEVEAGADDPSVIVVTQAAHGFIVENVLRVLGSGTYTKAQANNLINSRAVGIVVQVIDVNTFILQTSGFSSAFAGKVAATQYYLSEITAGLLTTTEPSGIGEISKPMFQALTATSGYILEQRPMLQPDANGGGGGSGLLANNIVQTNHTTSFLIPNGGPGDFPYSVTITPSSVTSRIRIMSHTYFTNSVSGNLCQLKRNGVALSLGGGNVGFESGATSRSFVYIDSPATIAPVTYMFQKLSFGAMTYNAGPTIPINTMIAEEIGP